MSNEEVGKFIGITLPEDLVGLIDKEADAQERSRSAQIRLILKEWFDNREK